MINGDWNSGQGGQISSSLKNFFSSSSYGSYCGITHELEAVKMPRILGVSSETGEEKMRG